MIEDFSVITHEGLTTLAHSSRMGCTLTSGTWNHLLETWGPTPETLTKIQASCKSQEYLEESNKLTPTRHILLALRQTLDLERIHGLPAVAAPTFFPSASRNEECWWGTLDPRTIYVGDSMDDQDKQISRTTLQETEIGWCGKPGKNLDTHSEEARIPPTPILQPRREGKHQ